MTTQFFDLQEPTSPDNGRVIETERELVDLLERVKSRPPFFCETVSEKGTKLTIGIGERGCVQFSAASGDPPYLMAVRAGAKCSDEVIEFLAGNTPTEVSVKYALPFDVVLSLAEHFQTTGEPGSSVSWEPL